MSLPVYAVIVAGGQGTRMGQAIPKQFLLLHEKPILYYTIKAFIDAVSDIKIILVLPEQQMSYLHMVLTHFPERIDITVVAGGNTRFQSVKNGLQEVPNNSIVIVHDGVRPLVSADLIQRCLQTALEKGSAIPAILVTDSIRAITENGSVPVDRNQLRSIQTPQTFQADLLLAAFQQEYNESFTDEATVVESYGKSVCLIEGEKKNIKITTPEDLTVASYWLESFYE